MSLTSPAVRSQHLYRLRWEYRKRWRIELPIRTSETVGFAYVEGSVEGRLAGRFHGVNHARGRSDARFLTDVQGVIEVDGDKTIMVDYQGYGCPYPRGSEPLEDRTKVVVAARHWTNDGEWASLNDSIAVGIGENRFTADGVRLLILDVHEIEWTPLDSVTDPSPRLPRLITIDSQPFDLGALE